MFPGISNPLHARFAMEMDGKLNHMIQPLTADCEGNVSKDRVSIETMAGTDCDTVHIAQNLIQTRQQREDVVRKILLEVSGRLDEGRGSLLCDELDHSLSACFIHRAEESRRK